MAQVFTDTVSVGATINTMIAAGAYKAVIGKCGS